MKIHFTYAVRLFTGCLLLICATAGTLIGQSNNNMGIGTTSPDASAILDISSNSKGLLIPRLSNGQQGGLTGPSGLLIYNTDQGRFNYYNGGWKPVGLWSANGNKIFYNTDNVGIGTNNPMSKLDIAGGLTVGGSYAGTNAAPANGAIFQGNVGIGTATVTNKLDVEGGMAVGATYSGSFAAPTNGAIIQGRVGIGTTDPDVNSLSVIAPAGAFRAGNFQNSDVNFATIYVNNLAGASGRGMWIENGKFTMNNGDMFMNSGTLTVTAPVGDERAAFFYSNDNDQATVWIENTFGSAGRGLWIETGKFTINDGQAYKPNGGPFEATGSDKRLKTDIKDYLDGLQQVRSISPVSYRYNGKENLPTKETYIGVIAQEIEPIAPYMVHTMENGYLTIDPNAFTYMLINAAKELDETVQKQQQIIEAQQAEIDTIKKALAKAGIKLD